jgi:3-deoxy-D-manno-octulosonate 8-phosphate phosphatase (KDO 8-P phosphatase)
MKSRFLIFVIIFGFGAIAVNNAHTFVKQHCDWVTTLPGGKGAVREITDLILESQSLLEAMQKQYLK